MPKKYDPGNNIPITQKVSIALQSIKNEIDFIDHCKRPADFDAIKRSIRGNINILLDALFDLPNDEFKKIIGKIQSGYSMIAPMVNMLGIGKNKDRG